MCRVLCGKLSLGGHGIDFGGERVEGVSQGRSDGAERWQHGGETVASLVAEGDCSSG